MDPSFLIPFILKQIRSTDMDTLITYLPLCRYLAAFLDEQRADPGPGDSAILRFDDFAVW